jgi:hypothetical protein
MKTKKNKKSKSRTRPGRPGTKKKRPAKKKAAKKKKRINVIIGQEVDIQLKAAANQIGKPWAIEYENKGELFHHRMKKGTVYVGKGFILIEDPSIKLTDRGIEGG